MPQFCLSWQNVNVTTLQKTKTFWKTTTTVKVILDNVSGFASSNSLFVIMGSSGSGKTSLLRAISGRCPPQNGVLAINNKAITNDELKSISGFVPQQDIFTEYLTVLEHLRFMAALKLKSKTNHRSHIKQVLVEFCLERQSSTLIKNLSGGEKRRLSLASELLSDPPILFCDEATTGLDSYNSLIVVEKLQKRAATKKIVLTTIHQPSSQLFNYFDNITLLAEGKLVFQGTRDEADSFFASMNLSCPSNYNPMDFYIRCIAFGDVSKMCDIFKSQKPTMTITYDQTQHNLFLENKNNNSFLSELTWLVWRNFLSIKRNRGAHLGTYFAVLVELLGVAIIYSQISLSDPQSPQAITGFCSLIASEFTFTNMYSVINVFPSEVDVFIREKTLYSSHAYFISKVLSSVPLIVMSTTFYMSTLFVLVTFLKGFYLYLQMTFWMFLISLAACGLGLAFSATFSNAQHIDLYLGPVEFVLLLFSGLMLKLNRLPAILAWIKYISPFYYGFDSTSNLFWEGVHNLSNCTIEETLPCYNNGIEVLENYGIYREYSAVYNIVYLLILTATFMVIGFLGILRKKIVCSI